MAALESGSASSDQGQPDPDVEEDLEQQPTNLSLRAISAPPSGLRAAAQVQCEDRSVSDPSGLDKATPGPTSDEAELHPELLAPLPGRSQRTFPARSWVATVTQNVSSTLERNISATIVVPTQRCTICLENMPASDCVSLKGCGRETHGTCLECLKSYLKFRIEDARVAELRCPSAGSDGCDAYAKDEEIEQLLQQCVVEKYKRFKLLKSDKQLRECPQCNELCSPLPRNTEDPSAGIIPELTCLGCSCNFCFYHSNAHDRGAKACADYERQMVKEERRQLAGTGARKCPHCGILTEKSSGCNHMTCFQCRANWCWVCGKEITNVGWHFNPLKPLSCEQFVEKSAEKSRQKALMYLTKLLVWPATLVTMSFIVSALLVLIFIQPVQCVVQYCNPCCWFRLRRYSASTRTERCLQECMGVSCAVTLILVGLPFCVFFIAWIFAVIPLWLLLTPCGARRDHYVVMASVPFMTVMACLQCLADVDPAEELQAT